MTAGPVRDTGRCRGLCRRRGVGNGPGRKLRAWPRARHRRDLNLPEQNTAAADLVAGSGTPTLPAAPWFQLPFLRHANSGTVAEDEADR